MLKQSSYLIAAFVAAGAIAGSASTASANHGGKHPCNCGPKTTKHVKTVHPAKSVTRYHDVNVVKRVPQVHRVVNIVRIQPIVRIHDVTRIHHHTVFFPRYTYSNVTQHIAPIRQVTHSVIHTYDCRCGY